MEHLNNYYTIERHLEEAARVNPAFKILESIWQLNKRNLSMALANVSQYFPHYSLHEHSHSNTIIRNIESFLGEERIRRLSPTNSWLILMASFTHDLGMIVFQDLVERELESENFQSFLREIREGGDDVLRESGEVLINLQSLTKAKKIEVVTLTDLSPVKVKNSLTHAVAEYMRRIHHKRSSDILKGVDKLFHDVARAFYSDQIPKRLMNLLGEIAYLHGVDFYEIFSRLDFEANGISNDKINPRFIAALLRLGDLLDVDDKRFNVFTDKVFSSPESTRFHQEKHSSIRHLLITPDNIEITSDCPNEEVYRLTRSWFDWLENEVEKQGREWSNIAPSDLGGSSPRIGKGKIKVYFNNRTTDERFLNLRFEVSNKKIFEILEGSSIYENPGFTFIRELVQNALDASKIQLWTDIEKGTYDFAFHEHFEDKSLSTQQIIERIKFPTDIPNLLNEIFDVKLSVEWLNEEKKILVFTVEDRGTGISASDLLRMTNQVGESRKRNEFYSAQLNRMPFWLKPTGAFGIGLQSVFIVSDSFRVHTKADGEEAKEIIFRSAKKGKYSSITKEVPLQRRGTKVIVEIPESRFPQIFGTSFSWDIIMDYDYFTDDNKSIYIPKIERYIKDTLKEIKPLDVNFLGNKISKADNKLTNLKLDFLTTDTSVTNDIQCRVAIVGNDLYFEFYESLIGSKFGLLFFGEDMGNIERHLPLHKTTFYVRDIPVDDTSVSYNKLYYCKLYWNFLSPESDKILSLNREKFISIEKSKMQRKFLEEVIPKAVELMEIKLLSAKSQLLKKFASDRKALAYCYFKLLLTKNINGVSGRGLEIDFLGDSSVPLELASSFGGEAIKMVDFFGIEEFIVCSLEGPYLDKVTTKNVQEECIINGLGSVNNAFILWKNNFFTQYILTKYFVRSISFSAKGKVIVLSKTKQPVELKTGANFYYRTFFNSHGEFTRGWSYCIDKYRNQLSVVNNYASGFESFPYLSSESIISPFKSKIIFDQFKDELKHIIGQPDREILREALTNSLLSEYISQNLIDWVIENKPMDISKRDKIDVIEGYRSLIVDILIIDLESSSGAVSTSVSTKKELASKKKTRKKK